MPRLKLVVWKLQIFGYIMPYFLAIIALDLTKVIWYSIQTILVLIIFFLMRLTSLSGIDSDSRGRAFSTLLIFVLVFIIPFFLFLFLSFLEKLSVIKALGELKWFWTSSFRFFYLEVLNNTALALSNSGFSWLIAIGVVLIHLLSARTKLKSRFGLDVDSFVNHLIEAF